MSEAYSEERRKLMRYYGAKGILTPAAERTSGMVRLAEELSKKHGWFFTNQFDNEANVSYHRATTATEILSDFAGERLDYFVSGWGTGGTIVGVGEMMRLARPSVGIIAAEPAGASLLSGKVWYNHKRLFAFNLNWKPDFTGKCTFISYYRYSPLTISKAGLLILFLGFYNVAAM